MSSTNEEAGRVLEDLRTVLPERNLRVPDVASAAPDEHKESDLEACDSESDVDGDVEACDSDVDGVLETCDSDVDGDRDLSESQDADSDPNLSDSEDADDCQLRVSHAWTFPKAHAMCHATTTIGCLDRWRAARGSHWKNGMWPLRTHFNAPTTNQGVNCKYCALKCGRMTHGHGAQTVVGAMKALVLRYLHTPAVHARMPHFKTMCT